MVRPAVPRGHDHVGSDRLSRQRVALCCRYRIAGRRPGCEGGRKHEPGSSASAKGSAYSLRMVKAVLIVIDMPGRIKKRYGSESCIVMFAPTACCR